MYYFLRNDDKVSRGRILSYIDEDNMSRVCLISDAMVEEFFYGVDPVGETIYLNALTFEVVGLLNKSASTSVADMMSGSPDIMIPYTTALKMNNESLVTSFTVSLTDGVDSEAFKTGLAQKRVAVAGLADRVRCVTFNACDLAGDDLPDALRGTFDLVFVDAPCSGTGTMRRHPEIAWSLDEAAVKRGGTLPTLQGALLSAAAAKVRPGGALVYATCSVLPEENAAMIDAFLSSGLGASFEVQSVSDAAGVRTASPEARALVRDATDEHGFLQTLPRQGSCDGHFCARLVRR